ncbi:MAG: FGGY-family carbohydrate kinase [Gammaproteobacteria bacterium]|nr:FGGY-family carbohydrate kinase [Gammaproteobacteria bacterium]
MARPSPLFIGVDLGTSGCRAIAIDASGEIKAQEKVSYANRNHKQQTPDDWWQATQAVLHSITSKVNHQHIQAIAIDGTSSTVLLCDDAGHPLTPALMYDEQRAKPQADLLQQYAPKNSVVLNSTSGLAKILWLLEHHQPEEPFHIVHQADWIAGQLCRRFDFSDFNNALKTGFDPVNKIWPLWLLELFKELKINPASLPKVVAPGSVIANINLHIARDLGLPIDVEIIAGTTDSTAAFMASSVNKSGATKIGQAVTSLGSTLVLKVISDIEINDPAHGVYSQPYGQHWLVGGASNSGGAVLNYYFNDEQMLALTKQLKPGEHTNLNYYPLIEAGERFPVNDPNLAPRLTPKVDDDAFFFQGLLEGIAEIEHTGYRLLEQLGAPYPTSIQTAGGGAINNAWQQIREHKLGVPVTAATHTAAAYGTAKLAAKNYS